MKTRIIKLLEETERPGIENIIAYMDDNGFFTAPCSGQHHGCKESGLMEHSLNVYEFGWNHCMSIIMDCNISVESWVIVSLLHDIGKSGYRNKQHYIPNVLQSGKVSTSKPYETNKDRLFISHEIVSLQIASKFIELTEEEEFAILYHNGMYTSIGKDIQGKERPLQQILHFSDMWCSRFIEKGGE